MHLLCTVGPQCIAAKFMIILEGLNIEIWDQTLLKNLGKKFLGNNENVFYDPESSRMTKHQSWLLSMLKTW